MCKQHESLGTLRAKWSNFLRDGPVKPKNDYARESLDLESINRSVDNFISSRSNTANISERVDYQTIKPESICQMAGRAESKFWSHINYM